MSERVGRSRTFGKGTVIYATDGALNCLAVNSKAELLATAGRNIFHVFSIHADKFLSIPRAKSAARLFVPSTAASADLSVNASDSNSTFNSPLSVQSSQISGPRAHSVTDVTWSCADNILATGSSNGAITLWEVSSAVTQFKSFCGHLRSIHCLVFHPSNPWELLTASQDGKLNLFDTREPNPGTSPRTFIQRTALPTPVRDVTYCPRNSYLFAAAQENGTLSIWDTRQPGRPYLAFQGHSCSIASLDWLPTWPGSGRNWLATAGAVDHLIKVWNFNQIPSGSSGCPPIVYTVRTSNVSRVRWRPGFPTQLVSSCNQTFDLSAYLWDLKRPYLPYASFEEHKSIVTSISWCPAETDYFYTVGRDGLLIRHCVADGIRPAESASPIALAFSPRGNVAHAVSRDRVLAVQPPPVVDETNVVTQSIYYPPRRTPSNLLHSTSNSSMALVDAPPGFYAAPSSEKSDHLGLNQAVNLPEMGSARSAELFVSQAQSLLFCFEPSVESMAPADWLNSSSALVPDLIIALAKHYRFIGPSVDRVCSHNAAVALRFGQSFLVQFWSMLRAIYGSTINIPERRKPSSARGLTGHGPVKTFVEFEESPDMAVVGSQTRKSSGAWSDSGNRRESGGTVVKPLDALSGNASEQYRSQKSGGVYLADMLQALGVHPESLESNTSPGHNLHGEAVDFSGQIQPENVVKPEATYIPIYTSRRGSHPIGAAPITTEPSIPSRKTLSQSGQIVDSQETETTAAVSNTIPIRRRGVSVSKTTTTGRSPGSTHMLGISASSAHTCDSLGEPVDFLFHYPQTLQDELDGSCTQQTIHVGGQSGMVEGSVVQDDKETNILREIGAPDDPVLLDTGAIPDEAFLVRHPLEQHLQVSFETRDENLALPVDKRMTGVKGSGKPVTSMRSKSSSFKARAKYSRASSIISEGKSQGVDASTASTNECRTSKPRSTTHSDTTTHLLAPFNSALGPSPRHTTESALVGAHQMPDASPLVVQWFYELVESGHVQTVCTALLALGPERLRITEWVTEARISSWFMAYLELLSRFRLWTVSARIIKQCGSSKGGVDSAQLQKELRRAMTMQTAIRPTLGRAATEPESDSHKAPGTTASASDNKQDTGIRTRWKSGSASGAAAAGLNSNPPSALAPDVSSANQTSTTLSIHCGRCSKRFVANEATHLATGHAGWACSRHASTADAINATCALCHQTVRGLFVWCRGCSHGGHLEHMQAWLSKRSECPTGCGHRCEYG